MDGSPCDGAGRTANPASNAPQPALLPYPYQSLDENGEILRVNDAWLDALGYDREAVVGEQFASLLTEAARERFGTAFAAADAETGLPELDLRLRHADGHVVTATYSSRVETDDEGTLARTHGQLVDVTDADEPTDAETDDGSDPRRPLFEKSPLVIWEEDFSAVKRRVDSLAEDVEDVEAFLSDEPDRLEELLDLVEVVDVNRTAVDYYGADSKADLLSNLDAIFTEEAYESFSRIVVALATGETRVRTETVARTLDGRRREELLEAYVPDEHADDWSRVYVTSTDISERKEYQRRLKEQRDDLDVLNQVVRHDIRNDLQLVLAHAELLAEQVDEDGREHVETILESAEHAVDLTRTARDMAEVMLADETDREPVGLRSVLEGEIAEVQSSYPDAAVTVEGSIPAVTVRANDMLDSVFRNVLKNAIQHNDAAVPEVTVAADETDDAVRVRIADNGPGVPDDRKEEIFGKGETGLDSSGTGLGLYLVETLVDDYGGDVWVEDRAGGGPSGNRAQSDDSDPNGAVFVVELPTTG